MEKQNIGKLEEMVVRDSFLGWLTNGFTIVGKDGKRRFDTSWYYPIAGVISAAAFLALLVAARLGEADYKTIHQQVPAIEYKMLDKELSESFYK